MFNAAGRIVNRLVVRVFGPKDAGRTFERSKDRLQQLTLIASLNICALLGPERLTPPHPPANKSNLPPRPKPPRFELVPE